MDIIGRGWQNISTPPCCPVQCRIAPLGLLEAEDGGDEVEMDFARPTPNLCLIHILFPTLKTHLSRYSLWCPSSLFSLTLVPPQSTLLSSHVDFPCLKKGMGRGRPTSSPVLSYPIAIPNYWFCSTWKHMEFSVYFLNKLISDRDNEITYKRIVLVHKDH